MESKFLFRTVGHLPETELSASSSQWRDVQIVIHQRVIIRLLTTFHQEVRTDTELPSQAGFRPAERVTYTAVK